LIGAAVGVGVYTYVYAKGASYLMNNPAPCANCHYRRAGTVLHVEMDGTEPANGSKGKNQADTV
jgi:hypothetical protein